MDDLQTLARFVERGRRIAAHSLLQEDQQELFRQLVSGSMTLRMSSDGTSELLRPYAPEEEVLESLAARVRPVMLPSESIYWEKVLAAVERLLPGDGADDLAENVEQLKRHWPLAADVARDPQRYTLQHGNAEGQTPSAVASETMLAGAWMYADLVHADAKGLKAEALGLPFTERYAAASQVIPQVASLAVSMLRVVEALHTRRVIALPEDCWTSKVVIDPKDFTALATPYVADVGTELSTPTGPGSPWEKVTPFLLLRMDPQRRCVATLRNSMEEEIWSGEALLAHGPRQDDPRHHMIVAEVLHVQFDATDREHERPAVTLCDADRSTVGREFIAVLDGARVLAVNAPSGDLLFRLGLETAGSDPSGTITPS